MINQFWKQFLCQLTHCFSSAINEYSTAEGRKIWLLSLIWFPYVDSDSTWLSVPFGCGLLKHNVTSVDCVSPHERTLEPDGSYYRTWGWRCEQVTTFRKCYVCTRSRTKWPHSRSLEEMLVGQKAERRVEIKPNSSGIWYPQSTKRQR